MQIYYDNAEIPFNAIEKLSEYDLDSTTSEDYGILDNDEIEAAGGLDLLMQELTGYCVGFAPRGPLGEYDAVSILSTECLAGETTETASVISSDTNSHNYPGAIISIPGGQFNMGSINGDSDESTNTGETVAVTMSDFKLSKTEVTLGQYKIYLAATGDPEYSQLPDFEANKKGDNFPVVGLKYDEMVKFCEYYGGTLPTAAQIEYASKGRFHNDPYGTPIDKAITYTNGARTTAEVCGEDDERANDYGVCDLAGNVWETTADTYSSNFYDRAASQDPTNPMEDDSGSYEVRGGSCYRNQWYARSAFRSFFNPDGRNGNVGFRCAWPQDS
ncbi:MAG: formylglycine-generating enzyme family protein [bacterium]